MPDPVKYLEPFIPEETITGFQGIDPPQECENGEEGGNFKNTCVWKYTTILTNRNISDRFFDIDIDANELLKGNAYINAPGFMLQFADRDFVIERTPAGLLRRVRFIPPFIFEAGMQIDCFVWI